jgi:hypothetical protein
MDLNCHAKLQFNSEDLTVMSGSELSVNKFFIEKVDVGGGDMRDRKFEVKFVDLAPNGCTVMDKFVCKSVRGNFTRTLTKPELVAVLDGGCEVESWEECAACTAKGARPCKRCAAKATWELSKDVANQRFLRYLAFQDDIGAVLTKISKAFQVNCAPVATMADEINAVVKDLMALKKECGPKEKLVQRYCDGEYKDGQMPGKHGWKDGSIQLNSEDGELAAHKKSRKSLVKSLASNFTSRFVRPLQHPVVQAMIVFEHRLWPAEKEELEQYGQSEIQFLISHYAHFFNGVEAKTCLEQWQ